jgi:nucleotide-binding universal stress UspA family protein
VEEKAEANYFFEGVISRAKAQAQAVKLRTHILAGQAVGTIVAFVGRERPDLLVIGYMGHSALYNRVIGSTTDRARYWW